MKSVPQALQLCLLLLSIASLGSLQAAEAPARTPDFARPLAPLVSITLNGRPTEIEMEDLRNPLMLIQTTRGDFVVELYPSEAPLAVANFVALAEGNKTFIDPRSKQELQRPFYDGLNFHRVIDKFIIQGGSPNGLSSGSPGFSFNDEINAIKLGLHQMMLLDEQGYPNPQLGITSKAEFQEQVLKPLYESMNINSTETLEIRIADVDARLRSMSVQDYYELLGYRYSQRYQSRAPVKGMIAMSNSGPNSNGSQFFITLSDAMWLAGKHTVFGKVRGGMNVIDTIGRTPVDADKRPLDNLTILSIRKVTI